MVVGRERGAGQEPGSYDGLRESTRSFLQLKLEEYDRRVRARQADKDASPEHARSYTSAFVKKTLTERLLGGQKMDFDVFRDEMLDTLHITEMPQPMRLEATAAILDAWRAIEKHLAER